LQFIHGQLEQNHYILPGDTQLLRLVHSASEAATEISDFYRNFHSTRWLQECFVVRMNHPLSAAALATVQREFADLASDTGFQQQASCASETDEPELCHLMRLAFAFNGRDHGRLRQLVDFINLPQNWTQNA
jgi:hypothetical protein